MSDYVRMTENPNYVTMAYFKEHMLCVPTGARLFKPVGRLLWLKKWMWKFLDKHKCLEQYEKPEVEYERIVIDKKTLVDGLFTAYSKSFPAYKRPRKVYIGPEQMSELLKDPRIMSITQPIDFSVPTVFNQTLFNLPVEMVPHMNGVLIV